MVKYFHFQILFDSKEFFNTSWYYVFQSKTPKSIRGPSTFCRLLQYFYCSTLTFQTSFRTVVCRFACMQLTSAVGWPYPHLHTEHFESPPHNIIVSASTVKSRIIEVVQQSSLKRNKQLARICDNCEQNDVISKTN